jgi:hypothetical protein
LSSQKSFTLSQVWLTTDSWKNSFYSGAAGIFASPPPLFARGRIKEGVQRFSRNALLGVCSAP